MKLFLVLCFTILLIASYGSCHKHKARHGHSNETVSNNGVSNERAIKGRSSHGGALKNSGRTHVKSRTYNDDSPETIATIDCYCNKIKQNWNTKKLNCEKLRYFKQQVGGEAGSVKYLQSVGVDASKHYNKDKLADLYADCAVIYFPARTSG